VLCLAIKDGNIRACLAQLYLSEVELSQTVSALLKMKVEQGGTLLQNNKLERWSWL
jgi:hypothetical protein